VSALARALLAELDDDALDALADALAPRLQRRLDVAAPVADGWLDTAAAANYLGVSRHALHRLTAERRVPFVQDAPGARCYFRRADLDDWRRNGSR